VVWQPPEPATEYEAVGVYIFAGGFTIGMADQFRIRGHLEDGMFGVNTFKANFPRVPVWINPDRWPADRFKGIDVVYGNPPCAPWSPIGSSMRHGQENWRSDPNVDCARRLIDFGLKVQPKI
jgi:site-specific DNA-cytosine methylase